MNIRIATRESELAKWQADWVAGQLRQRGFSAEMVYVTTHGDIHQTGPVETIGTQGVFTKEVQRAVLENRADIAVHSLKDLPTIPTEGLILAAVPDRAPVSDCLVSNRFTNLAEIPAGTVIGTGSLRRKSQLLALNSGWIIEPIRGNLQTRLRKLDNSDPFQAIILAEAGLKRMGYSDRIAQIIPINQIMPAVSQGALGLECRKDDFQTQNILSSLNNNTVQACVIAERAMLKTLQGGCLAPVGCVSKIEGNNLILTGRVIAVDGRETLQQTCSGTIANPEELGICTAEKLLALGADNLIGEARNV